MQVLDQLKVLKEAAQQTGEPMEKVIIVSSWTSFLNIMAQHLTKRGYTFVVLDGTVHVHERLNIMDKFNGKDKTADIMLLSITAGGVGLNLTGANHVYFVEPQWNVSNQQIYNLLTIIHEYHPNGYLHYSLKSNDKPKIESIVLDRQSLSTLNGKTRKNNYVYYALQTCSLTTNIYLFVIDL
jgi:hypothetical protein